MGYTKDITINVIEKEKKVNGFNDTISPQLMKVEAFDKIKEASFALNETTKAHKEVVKQSQINRKESVEIKDLHSSQMKKRFEKGNQEDVKTLKESIARGIRDWQPHFNLLNSEESMGNFIIDDALTKLAKVQQDFVYKFNAERDMTKEERVNYEYAKEQGKGDEYLNNLKIKKETKWKEDMNQALSTKLSSLMTKHTDGDGNVNMKKVQAQFSKFIEKIRKQKSPQMSLHKAKVENGVELGRFKKFSKQLTKLVDTFGEGISIIKGAFSKVSSALGKIGINLTGAFNSIKDSIFGAADELKKMTKFNSSGRYTSLEIEEEKAELGASSDAEFYAMKQAMEKLNMGKDEFFMGGVNDERNKALKELMELEKKKYEEMKNSGALKKMEEAQQRLQDFQNELRAKVISVIADIAPLILDALNSILSVLSPILNAINSIYKFLKDDSLTDEEVNAEIDSILNQTTQNMNNNNIVITNSMHSVNPGMSNRHQLEKAGQQNGVTVARALGY